MLISELFEKVKFFITTPNDAFKKYKKEVNVRSAFSYYAVLSLLNIILIVIVNFLFPKQGSNPLNLMSQDGFVLVLSYITSLVFTFIIARISHLWLSFVKGKGSFKDTYQLVAYSQTPTLLFGFLPAVSFFAWIYELVIFVKGSEVLHGFSRKKAILWVLIPRLILTIVFVGIAAYVAYISGAIV